MKEINDEIIFELNGLNCADCAQKIERNINKLEGIQSAKLTFATQKLSIIPEPDTPLHSLEAVVKKTVHSIEPDVEVLNKASSLKTNRVSKLNPQLKKDLAALTAGSILFAAGLITSRNFVPSLTMLLLAWLVTGGKVLRMAAFNIIKGRIFDENFLMTIATIGALATGQYPEAAAVMLFYKVGMLLEDMAVNNSRKSIAGLINLRPESANLKTETGLKTVNPGILKVGDIVVSKPGERIPVDSIVLEGESLLDTSSLTGESLPKAAGPGDQVLGGFINNTGMLTLKVTNTLGQSAVTRILELVQNAASKKAPMESFVSKFAAYYTPVVTISALLTAILPPFLTGSMDFKTWIYKAMIFLVISCPCALVVSIPLTFFAGIGKASSRGILIKGGNYLEALNKAETVVFDKTGTLTYGKFSVSGTAPENCNEIELLEYAACAETNSSHPIARSIVEAFGRPIDSTKIQSFEEVAGKGVKAVADTNVIMAGNLKFMEQSGMTSVKAVESCTTLNDASESDGTMIYVSVNNEYKGWIKVSDTLKGDAAEAVNGLRKNGLKKVVMLTGDARRPAEAAAKALMLDEVHYGLLPHQKVEMFEQIKQKAKGGVIFAGDGINDAPVLATADIGVSMGGLGSDAAIEASDIVLMTDEPSKLVEAVKIAALTKKTAIQNVIFAISIKVLVLLLGTAGIATMWEAVFADVGVTLLAVLNTMKIRYMKKSV